MENGEGSQLTTVQKRFILLIIFLTVVLLSLITFIIFLLMKPDFRAKSCRRCSWKPVKNYNDNVLHKKSIQKPKQIITADKELATASKFIVSLHHKHSDGKDVAYCVGSILSEHWFLTSSVCLHQKIKTENLYARAGTIYHSKGGTTHPLVHFEIPDWRMGTDDYYTYRYIGVAKVSKPFDINHQSIVPGVLPQQYNKEERFIPHYDLFTFGWGTYISTKVPPKYAKLKVMQSEIYATATCKNYLQADELRALRVIENVLCAGNISAPADDQCNIDAGAPLTYSGIINGVSWSGTSCKNYPTVYSKVCLFANWTKKYIDRDV